MPVKDDFAHPFELASIKPRGKPFNFIITKHTVRPMFSFLHTLFTDVVARFGITLPSLEITDNLTKKDAAEKLMGVLSMMSARFHDAPHARTSFSPPPMFREWWNNARCNFDMVTTLLDFAYCMAIPNPRVLNKGRGNATYGEIQYPLLAHILSVLKMSSSDVFLDMGSGIGQVVLYVAATTDVRKAYGIEKDKLPATLGFKQKEYFDGIMEYFEKQQKEAHLIHESFLEVIVEPIIYEATVIFINNRKFNAELSLALNQTLMKCKSGTRIVTSKKLVERTETMKKRDKKQGEITLDDVSECVEFPKSGKVGEEKMVSWTANGCAFYLTTMK
ncbi:hypothetical protein L5515_019696 [Caenorhabditis briggsae]|uniref:Histone-lysine N-methyltransferase, H3 lysine-79 specific n=1 Tax=Caenorhabditis briggsae TaxID=6238 RepID=A0AAE9JUE2_CAEBR|nr:hypothetical protein L5515_019696 [Caenorhabditis briggsae]